MSLGIWQLVLGEHQANTYLVFDEKTRDALILDPGDEKKKIMKTIYDKGLKPNGIVLTHCHTDHIGAVNSLRSKYGCPVYAHKKEFEGLADPLINFSGERAISLVPEIALVGGERLSFGNLVAEVIHTPGHTPGSICLKILNESVVFTGDTLFSDDVGRTDLAGGNEIQLKNSIKTILNSFHDVWRVYPGHDESALLSEVRPFLEKFIG